MTTITAFTSTMNIPEGAVVHYVLAKWASAGSGGLLELGPSIVHRLWAVIDKAEETGTRVSSPDATHSRNVAVRPEVCAVVFDSHVAIGTGQGVYMSAVAELVEGDGTARGINAFSCRSVAHGGRAWTSEDVGPSAGLRLYMATVNSHWVLAKDGRPDHRIEVPLR